MAHDILAVDDSPSMRALVAATLAEAGYKVVQAEDGVQALEIAKKEPVRLVVADVNMPRMDGLTLLKHLRGLAAYKFTPILILTTEISAEKKAVAKSAGATGWLVKPFDPQTLLSTIKRVIK
ncbi:MAG: response regulator [Deltaproteobacteria bacterium]|nr:response regulator [Deltaproteobacteria bacterium]